MEQFVSLKASAGSGKTFALTVRYISLLLLDANPTEILTLTFTNKAAAEMEKRIFDTLKTLGDNEIYLLKIIEQTNLTKEQIISRKEDVLQKYITTELSIYTIDKFINKVLREFSGYVNISDDFSIVTNDEEMLLYKYLQSLQHESFEQLIDFAFTQQKKLSSIFSLFSVLYEKNENFSYERSFDHKLLEQCRQAIMKNAFKIKDHIRNCETISKTALNAVDFNSVEELMNKGKTWLTKDTLSGYSTFKKANPDHLQSSFEDIKIDLVKYIHLKEQYILSKLFTIYNQYKQFRLQYNSNKNSLEFNDITNIVYELLGGYIDKEFLYFRLDSRYNHLLIDEFQDTSILQYKILEPLIQEVLSGSCEEFKTFFYVGDTKQSIYRFRGGNSKLFDYVLDKFSPQIKLHYLDTNYRSGQNVVWFVNSIFDNISNYSYKHQKANAETIGLVQVELFDEQQQTIYATIAQKVDHLLKQGLHPNDITILTYTNEDILNIYSYLKTVFPNMKINTEITSKLIFQRNVSAIINVVKYLYFQEKIYLANFNSLIGRPIDESLDIKIDILSYPLESIVLHIAKTYNLLDENVIKFLEIIGAYGSLIDFIYEIDQDDTPMINKEKSGLQLMTIFKSKGLEFDTVILLDRLKGANHDRSSLLFEYEGITLNHIFYKSSQRENLDPIYADALVKEKSLSYTDQLNIFYVALTRAKNNMIILKQKEKSVFDMLGDKFYEQTLGKLHIENNGDKNFKEDIIKIEYQPLDLGYQEEQISGEEQEEKELLAQYFGLATHYCLEMIKGFEHKWLENAIQMTKIKYGSILDDDIFDEIVSRIEMLLANGEFLTLIDNAQFYKEQSLIFDNELKVIDLLIAKDDKFVIIDYKTTKQHHQSHFIQVRNYIKAIESIDQDKPVEGFVVYLQQDKIDIKQVDL